MIEVAGGAETVGKGEFTPFASDRACTYVNRGSGLLRFTQTVLV